MRNWTRSDVSGEVARLFPQEDPARVLAVLDEYGTASHEYAEDPDRARVQIAVLRLSEGNWQQLHYYLRAARIDHRDVLWWSGL